MLTPVRRLSRNGPRGRRSLAWTLLIWPVAIALASGCAGPGRGLGVVDAEARPKTVHVVSHGWHTGLVIRRADIPEGIWPVPHNFAESEYVEIGWGDRDFYQAPEATWGLAIRAGLWPSESVLHVVGVTAPPAHYFAGSPLVAIPVSDDELRELSTFVHDAYAKDASGRAIRLGPGHYGHSAFYLAREKYHLLSTCNTWSARALRAAGCPTTPLPAVTAGNVMAQAKRCAALRADPERAHASERHMAPAGGGRP